MTDRPQTTAFWRGKLPHWEVRDGLYFVTIHLAGAIPKSGADRIHEMSQDLSERKGDDFIASQRRIFKEMENWLDRIGDVRHLEKPEVAEVVQEAIQRRVHDGVWTVFEYAVMPNHLHMYVKMESGRLKQAVEKFKDWTGHEAAKHVPLNGGRFWQREWFDHWSRTPEEGERIRGYIRQNPVKAGLVARYQDWQHGSWNR